MRKGEQTRQQIIQQAATLFNQRGYTGSSISDLMLATGLQKGGIYRHFESKEALALAAFEYAQQQVAQPLAAAVATAPDAVQQLLAVVETFHALVLQPSLPGGCPIFNTIVDRDDGDPALRAGALAALQRWEQLIAEILARGVQQGSVRASADPQAVATVLISTLEGALLMSRIHADDRYMQHAVNHLSDYIRHAVALPPG